MTAWEGNIITEFYCVTFDLLALSWVTTSSCVCILIRLHLVSVLCKFSLQFSNVYCHIPGTQDFTS